ncbi:MAG: SpoIIE family protein phosphatase [Candidatus Eisenbacteria bacterium]|uniref:SpoIIE family protein phosphatase n=1 Tax=Eiseniibacteriota bacterium TaxID=2212470 RepID=A0A948RX34_UNCEI|nr:SpoIIE family protein phosphatase [Candidatus Eisenbacteria bacterium]MBU1949046.1 SpoIIE family protein phosphatase [Candidatus Eisenbacteria bacterium]MBU2692628.1 SpoIIE family protein phosphatase [Candidatus Eisenbacteria bacterium]
MQPFYRSTGSVIIIVLILLGPLLGMLTYQVVGRQEREELLAHCGDYLSERVSSLEIKMSNLFEVLYGIRSLFDSSTDVSRQEFRSFTARAISRHPSIKALEWIPRIPGDMRTNFESHARASGFENFTVSDVTLGGDLISSPQRDEYYPIFCVEPLKGNEDLIGYDVGSESTRRAALDRAIESADLALSDPVLLASVEGNSIGFLGFLPVYEKPVEEVLPEKGGLLGFATLALSIEEVLKHSFLLFQEDMENLVHFKLVDLDVNGGPESIWLSAGFIEASSPAESCEKQIELGGQTWSLSLHPTEKYFSKNKSKQPLIRGLMAFFGWEMILGIIFSLIIFYRNAALRKQDRILKSISRSLAEGVVVADRDGVIIFTNPAAQRMLKCSTGDRFDAGILSARGFFLPDTVTPYPLDQLPIPRAVRGEEVREAEIYVRNSELPGEMWLSASATPMVDESGILRGGVAFFRDVTNKKKSQELVQRLSSAVEQTNDTVLITDLKGKIEYVNPAFEKTTGYSRAEVMGRTPRILKSGLQGEESYKKLWDTILRGEVYRDTVINRKKNGEIYYAEQSITPMRDASGRIHHFVSVVKDMTEKLRTKEQDIEMQVAALVQKHLYPKKPPHVPGFDIAGATFPADAMCGDYYDFIRSTNGSLGIAIGDVSGHGFGPAMVMTQTRAYLRSLLQNHQDLNEILKRLNEVLVKDLELHRFVTLLYARLDIAARRIVYASAGHTSGFIIDPAGEVRVELQSTGLPLGVLSGQEYSVSDSIELRPGEIAIFLTDGITETQTADDRYFGIEGVLEIVKNNRRESAEEIVEHVRNAVRIFAAGMPQSDDITIVICKSNL